jgi:O-methyltransferase
MQQQNWNSLETIRDLLKTVQPFTLLGEDGRLRNLIYLSQYLNEQNIPGDFVECGTYKGGSAAVLSKYLGENRKLWLYDSFQGLLPAIEKDGEEAQSWIGECLGTITELQEVMRSVGTSEEDYIIKQGEVAAMESSKFWKVRERWIKIKSLLGLNN